MFKKGFVLGSFFILLLIDVFSQQPINVMSFNIRLNVASDGINAWPNRVDKVTSQIRFHDVEILGVQEALHNQMVDLQQHMKGFKFVGVGRDDGKTNGEYSAIFFDSSRFEDINSGTFWLSKQPTVPGSKDWDAAITRVCSWAKLRDRKGGKNAKTFYFFNTHFDHIGVEARKHSAELIVQKIKEIARDNPVILTGDFNTEPDNDPYRLMTSYLQDAKFISKEKHFGPEGTFTGFGAMEKTDEPIDYIFVSKQVQVLKHATLAESWKGLFSSDHYPVFARVTIGK